MNMLTDHEGKISTTRVLHTLTVLTVLVVWAWLSFADGAMYKIDIEVVALVIGMSGMKSVQSFAENGKMV